MPALLEVVTSQTITDGEGIPIVSGRITFVATDNYDNHIPFQIPAEGNTPSRQAIPVPVERTISNGTVTGAALFLGNPAVSDPPNILYRIAVTDFVSGITTVLQRVEIVDAGNGKWNLGSWRTGLSLSTVPISFVVGPQGPAGTIAIGSVITGDHSSVANVGTPSAAYLNFTLQQGARGVQGPSGSNSQVGNLSGSFARQAFTSDGIGNTFSLPVAGVPLIFRNGQLLEPSTDYTQSGTTINLTFTSDAGDKFTSIVFPSA